MNVAIVTYSLNYGGVSTFILTHAKEFSAKGDTVTIITTESKGVWFDKLSIPNVSYLHINGLASWWMPMFLYSYKIAAQFKRGNYDLIIINNSRQALSALSLISKETRAISVIHNDHPVLCNNACVNEDLVDAIVAVSPAVYHRASKIVKNKNKLVQVLNAIELETELRYSTRNNYKPKGLLKILFVGRLVDEQKGIFLIPQIAAILKQKDIRFQMELAGEGEDYKELHKQIQNLDVAQEVTFLGYINNAEIKDKLLQSHILLVPSNYEGLPLNVLEAMTRGCVPVMSDLIEITEICFDNMLEGIACKTGDSNSFADAIELIYQGKVDWSMLSNNARKKARAAFSSERMFKEYLALIQNGKSKVQFKKPFMRISMVDLIPLNVLNAYIKIKKKLKK
jgi:glycosyltransferase involved in cell wall biosynthesis